jgi:23S rRNA pseudouridine1911/1915/1917 synthase
MSTQPRVTHVPADMAGLRVDQALARLFPEHSRTRLAAWIRTGQIRVDARQICPKDRVRGGERIELTARQEERGPWTVLPLALRLVYEDEALLIVNKPPGLVVHPAPGHQDDTLVNALLHRAPELASIPRAGIVHRLDKDTSGLLAVARTLQAHTALVAQLQNRAVLREYEAIVVGRMVAGGTADAPIGRHPVDRKRMAVRPQGKPAVTHFRVIQRFHAHTRLRLRLETGRTHQIRVHMAHLNHPVLGDPVYGGRLRLPAAGGEELAEALRSFRRQALHAVRLELRHPGSGALLSWEAPIPEDMASLLDLLRRHDRDA